MLHDSVEWVLAIWATSMLISMLGLFIYGMIDKIIWDSRLRKLQEEHRQTKINFYKKYGY